MKKYVLLMKEQEDSPVRWHCVFDAEDYSAAVEIAKHVVVAGFSHNQPVELMLNGVSLVSIDLQSHPRAAVVRSI